MRRRLVHVHVLVVVGPVRRHIRVPAGTWRHHLTRIWSVRRVVRVVVGLHVGAMAVWWHVWVEAMGLLRRLRAWLTRRHVAVWWRVTLVTGRFVALSWCTLLWRHVSMWRDALLGWHALWHISIRWHIPMGWHIPMRWHITMLIGHIRWHIALRRCTTGLKWHVGLRWHIAL